MFSVKLGTTSDPFLSLASSTEVDLRTQEKKFSNRNRTLRAYLMKQKGGIVRLAFESAKPHAFFQLTGNYAVSPETVGIVWKDNSMVSFDGVNTKGLPTHFEFRLNDLEMKETSLPQLSVQILAPVIDVD